MDFAEFAESMFGLVFMIVLVLQSFLAAFNLL